MKKTAVMAAALVLAASQAYAYVNPYAGYSVKDNAPFYKLESNRIYAYSAFSAEAFAKLKQNDEGSVHIIKFYTPEEASAILDVDFTSDYFADEYAKLGVLERSELNLQTVPSNLLDFERYDEDGETCDPLGEEHIFKTKLAEIKPEVRIDKFGGKKVITTTYLYEQKGKLISLNLSQISANNRLYMLTTVTVDSKNLPQHKDSEADYVSEEAKVLPIDETALAPEVKNALWQKHAKFVKGFKTLQPTGDTENLVYTDNASKKQIQLPNDWMYSQVNFKEKAAEGCFTMAASTQNIQKIAQSIDYPGIFELMQSEEKPAIQDTSAPNADTLPKIEFTPELENKTMLEARKALDNFDAMLMTCSFKVKDKDFQSMYEQTMANKLTADLFLEGVLESAKELKNDNFKLNSYQYNSNHNDAAANFNINANLTLLGDYTYDNFLSVSMTQDKGTILLYGHKPEVIADTRLSKSISQWQF